MTSSAVLSPFIAQSTFGGPDIREVGARLLGQDQDLGDPVEDVVLARGYSSIEFMRRPAVWRGSVVGWPQVG